MVFKNSGFEAATTMTTRCTLIALVGLSLATNSAIDMDGTSTSNPVFHLDAYKASNLDILYDDSTRIALKKLREQNFDTRDRVIPKPEEDILESLEDLYTAGNADKSAMSLRGAAESQVNPSESTVSMVISPFLPPSLSGTIAVSQLLAVFDGHFGSSDAVQYIANALPNRLAEELITLINNNNNDGSIFNTDAVSNAITKSFQWVDRNVRSQGYDGSTASILLQLNDTIYMANVGTSQTFVATFWESAVDPQKNDVSVVLQSPETTLDLPEESDRILKSGGIIQKDENDGTLRVLPPDNMQDGTHPGIPMSRSIGDEDVIPGVIAAPKIGIFTLEEIRSYGMADHAAAACSTNDNNGETEHVNEDEQSCLAPKSLQIFAMAATEGVLAYPDTITTYDMAKGYAASFFVDGNPHPHTVSETALVEAANGWEEEYEGRYRPDMAIAGCKIWDV